MNRIFTIGWLTAEPQTKTVENSTFTSFELAANSTRKYVTGSYIPVFYKVCVWGKLAEQCATYLHKGYRCAVSGSLWMEECMKSSGEKGFTLCIENALVEFLATKREGATNI
ncbi:MAG: single-stranded DNA-binding protein [Clostridia bacterium]|nr:single-stranded DNA-binding protein [Clostridia bacterium]